MATGSINNNKKTEDILKRKRKSSVFFLYKLEWEALMSLGFRNF